MRLQIQLVMLGDMGVGKSTLVNLLKDPKFDWLKIQSTLQVELHALDMQVKGEDITLRITDTIGQRHWHQVNQQFLNPQVLRGTDVVLMVYDTTRPDSVDRLDHWWSELKKIVGTIPCVLVGTKTDAPLANLQLPVREWTTKTVQTTAKEPDTVKEAFITAVELVLNSEAAKKALNVTKKTVHLNNPPPQPNKKKDRWCPWWPW
eukprot:TRINITY_DN66693_c13_g5_i1.p1 TRINITY_DN66693_c13_g5~~TRINITY_DN66693_c13_g5_i1.p1  ORF type:complete len:204 (-),score=12.02 TRINITY_DN66693_c13_g5_i1:239-850(-)